MPTNWRSDALNLLYPIESDSRIFCLFCTYFNGCFNQRSTPRVNDKWTVLKGELRDLAETVCREVSYRHQEEIQLDPFLSMSSSSTGCVAVTRQQRTMDTRAERRRRSSDVRQVLLVAAFLACSSQFLVVDANSWL